MLRITNEKEFDILIHQIIHIASILRNVENGLLSEGQKLLIQGCEKRLMEIRQHLLETVEENSEGGEIKK